jgi:hypothetical protein
VVYLIHFALSRCDSHPDGSTVATKMLVWGVCLPTRCSSQAWSMLRHHFWTAIQMNKGSSGGLPGMTCTAFLSHRHWISVLQADRATWARMCFIMRSHGVGI